MRLFRLPAVVSAAEAVERPSKYPKHEGLTGHVPQEVT